MIDLRGKHALVTGGSRGIGRAICWQLAQAGADISFSYRHNLAAADRLVADIEGLGRKAICYAADASDAAAMATMFEQAESALGPISIAVANAGIWEAAPIGTMTLTDWQATMRANVDSLYVLCHHASHYLKAVEGGSLILIGSTAGQRGEAHYSHYAASKGAAMSLVKSLAAELGPAKIRVNCVAPGWVRTDMTAAVFEDKAYEAEVIQGIPLRRIAEPEDIAGPVVFLASNLAKHVTGHTVSVNGGSVLI